MGRNLTMLCLLLTGQQMFGQLDMIETEDMRLVTYDFGHAYILPHAGRCFHNALDFHRELFQYEPSEKVTVLIQDFGDYGNAGATAVPRNAISMGLSPFNYTFETSPAGERVYAMMNHELVHVVALDNATRTDRFFRGLFLGKVDPTSENPISMLYSYLTSPRRYSPRWYHEGIAAYLETWMGGGIGLALGSFDEMTFRTLTLEEERIYSAQGLESEGVTTDFQGRSNSYLYGTRFMGYLAYQYGPERLIEWVNRTDGSKRSFIGQFKAVFEKPIQQGWDEWIAFEKAWQKENLKRLEAYPLTRVTPITQRTIGSVSLAHYDAGREKIYAAVNYPGQVPHIAAIDLHEGTVKKLIDIKGAALFYVASLTYDADGDILYFTTDNNQWRDLNSYDLKTGKTVRLQRDCRTGDLAFNPSDRSIWGIKHLNGVSTITRIPAHDPDQPSAPAYSTWDQVHTLPYGQDIFDIDISPDGRILSAAVSDLHGNQSLLLYDLASLGTDTSSVDTIFNFEVSSPQSFQFTRDGKYLFGCSYYSGVSNIYRVDMSTGDIHAMSNTETGLFRPIEIDSARLFAFYFRSDGFQPVYIPNKPVSDVQSIDFLGNVTIEKHPSLKDWELPIGSASAVDIDSLTIRSGTYKSGRFMAVNYGYPIIVGYKNTFGIGYHMDIADPLRLSRLEFSFAYTPSRWKNSLVQGLYEDAADISSSERFHFSFLGKFRSFTISGGLNEANFHDLFGPRQNSRKGVRLGLDFDRALIWDPPKRFDLHVGLDGYYGLDQSPDFQQIISDGFDDSFYLRLGGSLSYGQLQGSLGGVDAEKGYSTSLRASATLSSGEVFPVVVGSFNYGIQLPGRHFSLWFRTAGGHAFSEAFNPFTRFGFAAFGNNYVDLYSSRQYRNAFAFPGISYDADRSVIARTFAKVTPELVLPPIRFRELGGFNFYANWIQPSLFSSYLYTPDEEFVNLGGQIDLRMVTFSLLPSTISFGYAKAWPIDGPGQYDEWMISLNLLH